MSWVVAAVSVGAARGIYGAVSANQTKQKNKGYISAAYRSANQKLGVQQQDVTQSNAESLVARGLGGGGGGGSAVRAAMVNGIPVSQGPAPTDLAGQSRTDLGKAFVSEQSDLDNSASRAQNENKAAGINAEIGSIGQGIDTAESVYGAGKTLGAGKTGAGVAPSVAPSSPSMTGIDDPANSWGGIHVVDPLGAPGSSWNSSATRTAYQGGAPVIGAGQPNFSFNTGNG